MSHTIPYPRAGQGYDVLIDCQSCDNLTVDCQYLKFEIQRYSDGEVVLRGTFTRQPLATAKDYRFFDALVVALARHDEE